MIRKIGTPKIYLPRHDPTLNLQIGASSDDAWATSAPATPYLTSVTLPLLSTGELAGLRFTGVNIPSDGIITASYLSLYLPDDSDDYFTDKDVYCENGKNPVTFEDSGGSLNRTLTTNKVTLVAGAQGVGWKDTPSLNVPIQEVVDDNAGTGDALVFIIISTGALDLEIQAWDEGDHSLGAKLHIEYTTVEVAGRSFGYIIG